MLIYSRDVIGAEAGSGRQTMEKIVKVMVL